MGRHSNTKEKEDTDRMEQGILILGYKPTSVVVVAEVNHFLDPIGLHRDFERAMIHNYTKE